MKRLIYALISLSLSLAAPSRANDETLPPIDTVLKHIRVMANHEQGNDRLFRSRYAYVQTVSNRELDSKGRIKKDDHTETRNNPRVVPASFKRPGPNANPPGDSSRSPRDNAVGKSKAGPTAPAAGSSKTDESDSKPYQKEEFALNDDLLSRFDYTIVKREQINGRNTLVIDFQPANKKLPNHGLKDRFINKTAGRVWVDEGDWMLAKIDFHLIDSVHVVGGLVGAVKAFTFHLDRCRTSDALWYVADNNWHLEGREFFSRKILEYEEHRSNVRKVGTLAAKRGTGESAPEPSLP